MTEHHARLTALRAQLAADRLDAFVIPLTDEHMSEYVGDYARRLHWLTGFEGSAGTVAVTRDRAAIFTDGRYTVQVRAQVDAADFDYVDVPARSVGDWLIDALPGGGVVGYDPWLHTDAWVTETSARIAAAGITLRATEANPVDAVWTDRPAMSAAMLDAQPDALAGASGAAKRAAIADALGVSGVDATVMAALDSIAWTFNLRGRDVARTPVGLAFAIVHADATADLFVDAAKLPDAVRAGLGNGVRVHPRAAFAPTLGSLTGKRVGVDSERSVAAIAKALAGGGATIVPMRDPAVLAKAQKNPVEQAGARDAHVRDAVAIVRFLRWIEGTAPEGGLDELAAADRLEALRREDPSLRDLSFDTISAAGPHAALPHYKVDAASNRRIEPSSVYLVDSGGQYPDGTTDITRTVWVGPGTPPDEVRDRFTRVLKGHIALSMARFPDGTRGGQLDALARQHLWAAGCDYAHGTGHGVGAYLSVHEGPQRIAKPGGGQAGTDEPLRAGMILSNEPGYYKTGAYGIRIENLVLVETVTPPGGDSAMLGFETLTFAPIDRALIAPALLSAEERAWLDAYHAQVVEKVGPRLASDDAAWLREACAPL